MEGKLWYDWRFDADLTKQDEYNTGNAERANTTIEELLEWYEVEKAAGFTD
jgi:hypothetical protein